MNHASLTTETQRRRAVDWAVALTADTRLAPQRYERHLLARYQQGDLTIDQVIELLDASVYQVLYRSRATAPLSEEQMQQLLEKARRFNVEHRISGLLLYSAGQFVQVLEGPEQAVWDLYTSIQQDARHTQVVTVSAGQAAGRHFAGWSMAFGNAVTPDLDRVLLAVQGPRPVVPGPAIEDPNLLALLRAFGIGPPPATAPPAPTPSA